MIHPRHATPRNIQTTEDVIRAAQWLSERKGDRFGPIISTMKARFGLSAIQGAEAVELAQQMRTVRRAFA